MKPKILLIDDDLDSLIYIIDFLSNYFEVSACDNESDFFTLIKKKDFDIFLLDINMPQTSGLEICRKVKQFKEFKYIPVIFVTASSNLKKIDEGFAIGAVDYVIKPFKPQELKIRINAHIKNSNVQIALRKEHLALHEEIKRLTEDLIKTKNQILNEENFQSREKTFQKTNIEVEERKESSEEFNLKFEEIQKKLEQQKIFLENAKLLLNN